MGVFVYWPETKDLGYNQTLDYIFNNLYTAVIDMTVCNKCGKTHYHSLVDCNCGGQFVKGSYTVKDILDRIKKHDQNEYRYNWSMSSFRDTLYCEFKMLLEHKLSKEQSGDVYSKVNRDFFTKCRELVK